jgi:putative protein kinase ArgK-like GTPase of G3E family
MSKSESVIQTRMQDTVMDHAKIFKETQYPIHRICLTGGPCAGKTTALNKLSEKLQELGFKVLVVPEAATLMTQGGCFIQTKKMSFADSVRFEKALLKLTLSLEDVFLETALNAG